MATLSFIEKYQLFPLPWIDVPDVWEHNSKTNARIKKNKYLTTFTYGRGSKWYMDYGSVLLRLGGVRSQRRNGYKNMIVEIMVI